MNVVVLLDRKEDILKNVGNRAVWGTIDFHSILFPTMEVNGPPKQPGYKLCQNKDIHTGLELLEGG